MAVAALRQRSRLARLPILIPGVIIGIALLILVNLAASAHRARRSCSATSSRCRPRW